MNDSTRQEKESPAGGAGCIRIPRASDIMEADRPRRKDAVFLSA